MIKFSQWRNTTKGGALVLNSLKQNENTFPVFSRIDECKALYSADIAFPTIQTGDFIEISIVVSGEGIHKVFSYEADCREGDVYITDVGVPHMYFAKSDTLFPTVITISFDVQKLFSGELADRTSPIFLAGVFRDNVPFSYAMLNSHAMSEILAIHERISEEASVQRTAWREATKAHLSLLLITLGRYINMADTATAIRSKEWPLVSRTMREVLKRYSDPDMTLEAIAASLFVSKSQLSRIFAKVTGDSFANYVRDVRISEACSLLGSTALTNEEIVKRCGLKDIPTFYKTFKSVMGKTPFQYRITKTTQRSLGENIMSTIVEISENVQRGKAKIVRELVEQAISEGVPAAQILNDGLLAAMNIVGEKFKKNEVYVPEVLVAARAMNMGIQVLSPLLTEDGIDAKGKVCIGTVRGDLHDIGKNLVKLMLEGKGLEVIDLGTDVAPETFVKTAIEENCQVICCSALLTTTMPVMKEVVEYAENAGVRDKVKILIGGAPVTDAYCKEIGADLYTVDAASAADAAVEFCTAQ